MFYTEEPDICFLVISIKYYVKDIQLYEMKGMPTVAYTMAFIWGFSAVGFTFMHWMPDL